MRWGGEVRGLRGRKGIALKVWTTHTGRPTHPGIEGAALGREEFLGPLFDGTLIQTFDLREFRLDGG